MSLLSNATLNMSAPPGKKDITMTTPLPQRELVEAVRHFVHFDNLAETLNKQVYSARTMRSKFEDQVLKMLEATGMKHATLQISGATLQRATRSKSVDLSWSFLEEQLHMYHKTKGLRDDTTTIMDFLQTHRGTKTQEYLKKTAEQAPEKTPGPSI
jgi:hypothetical protein